MNRFLSRAAAFAATWLAFAAWSAPFVPGEPARADKAAPQPLLRLPRDADAAHVELPPVDAAKLESLRESNRNAAAFKPREERRNNVGIVRDGSEAPSGAAPQALAWRDVEGGSAARISLTSPGAASVRLALALVGVPAEVRLVFFGSANPSRLEGPQRVGDVRDRLLPFWTPITEGDTQVVELFAPPGVALPESVSVSAASHLVTAPSTGLDKRVADIGMAGSCNVDIACSPLDASVPFKDVVESVAQMVFTADGFTTLCTGTLLADSDSATQAPWFYSANHCFENLSAPFKTPAQMQAVADTVTTLWGFQANTCGSHTPRADWTQVGGGSTYLYNNAQSDALLIKLNATPPRYAYFAGWDAGTIGTGTGVITIHHPEGDLKKTSQGTAQGLVTLQDPGPGGGSFISVLWSSGTTEPGSSGAGLFTTSTVNGATQYLFRGALWGGDALCTNTQGLDDFSRFDLAYPSVRTWLGTGAATAGPSRDYTDLWWGGPAESGWGLNLVQHDSRVIFGVWYTYDANGQRTWYAFGDSAWTSLDTYEGTLYTAAGPAQLGGFDPNAVVRTNVGTFTLTFSDANHGTYRWTVGGATGTKNVVRFTF